MLQRTNQALMMRHRQSFPISDNLFALVFLVQSDLTEKERSTLTQYFTIRNIQMQDYTWQGVTEAVVELLCAPQNSLEDPNIRPKQERPVPSSTPRSFCILEEYGWLDDCYEGYWVEDDLTGQEGFLEESDDAFWVFDPEEFVWVVNRFRGRRLRRGPRKGKGKGKRPGKKKKRWKGTLPLQDQRCWQETFLRC